VIENGVPAEGQDVPEGFVVGFITLEGYCECCHEALKMRERAALWNPTGELFCIDCARECNRSQYGPDWVPLALLAVPFVAAFILAVLT
jgi:hypothetical protein